MATSDNMKTEFDIKHDLLKASESIQKKDDVFISTSSVKKTDQKDDEIITSSYAKNTDSKKDEFITSSFAKNTESK